MDDLKNKSFWIIGIVIIVIIGLTNHIQRHHSTHEEKHIGVLLSGDVRYLKLDGLIDGMKEQGLLNGVHYQLTIKSAEDDIDKMQEMGRQLVSEEPDVLVALGGVEGDAIKEALIALNKQIPLVFAGVASSKERGWTDNERIAVTGVDNSHGELAGKRLEMLQQLLPDIKRILIVYDPLVTPALHSMPIVEQAAELLEIEIVGFPVANQQYLKNEFRNVLSEQKFDGIVYLSSFFLEATFDEMVETAAEYKVPIMGVNEYESYKGSFASYGVPYYYQGMQAAPMVAKVLSGQKIEQMPIEFPDRIELVVNMKVAELYGLHVSTTGLRYASHILYE